ncbi:MCP four helix bundle domain-containing protein [Azotobacter bryophylli]|uniref:MCP four helix bundle domain-containing protein n=1 Tax=Azotobacter bryophylli TaxID=1986537 RepID=A0ABV7AT31_9GAMM
MNLNDMKISTRLELGFGILTLLIILMGCVSLFKANHVDATFDTVVHDRYVKIAALNNAKDGLNQIARYLRNTLLMDDPADIREQLKQVELAHKGITEQWGVLEPRVRTEKGKALLANPRTKAASS